MTIRLCFGRSALVVGWRRLALTDARLAFGLGRPASVLVAESTTATAWPVE